MIVRSCVVCDVCGAVRPELDETSYERVAVCNTVVGYRYPNGWIRVPLATIGASTRGIDLCPSCPPDDQNLSALAASAR